jgi:hypothetical protein
VRLIGKRDDGEQPPVVIVEEASSTVAPRSATGARRQGDRLVLSP